MPTPLTRAISEPEYLAGPPLFWRLLVANLVVVLGGAVIGTTLTRIFVIRGEFTPLTHGLMVLAAIALSGAITALILHLAFQPLRALRRAIDSASQPAPAARERIAHGARYGDPDIIAVASAVHRLWDRLDQHVHLLEESNRRLEAQRAELAEKTVQLEQLALQVLAAQEEERRRVARELHDDTMQSVAALIMGLERGLEAMPQDMPHLQGAHRTVARLRDLAVRMQEDLRHMALDLRPSVLDDHGLEPTLRWLAQTQEERTGLRISFERWPEDGAPSSGVAMDMDGAGAGQRLPAPLETALYRIAQEALTNVSKHAQASQAMVRLRVDQTSVTIEVEDDGVGIEPGSAPPPDHMGLFNMRERASLLGGTFSVSAGPSGRGTLVCASLPRPAHRGVLPDAEPASETGTGSVISTPAPDTVALPVVLANVR